jgi:hypothetical protein
MLEAMIVVVTQARRARRALRWLGPAVIGAGLAAFVAVVGRMAPDHMTATAVLVIVSQVYVISELCHGVGRVLDRCAPQALGSRRRLAIELALGSVLSIAYAFAFYLPLKVWLISRGAHDTIGGMHVALIALAALGVSAILNLTRLTLDFLGGWQQAVAAASAREREVVQVQLDALRAQVNPHFLFNSLNTIYGVIAEDPPRAQALLLKLSEVFRYALRHGHTSLVSLSEELSFVAAFAELLEVRHGEGLVIERRLTGRERDLFVPPMTLQLLVENAVKHNRIDPGDALRVVIEHDDERLRVHNVPKPRRTPVQGEGRGLKNIAERFELVGAAGIAVRSTPARFEVEVPLLRRR